MNEIDIEIRKEGQQIMLLQKMAMAMKAQGKTELMLEQFEKIKEAAQRVYAMAAQGHKDGIVVYVHASGFITRTLSEAGMNVKAFHSGIDALYHSMELIETYNREMIFEPLPKEMECNFKTAQLLPLVIMFSELATVGSNMAVFEEDYEPFDDLHQMFLKCMRELKMIAPSSPLVAQTAQIVNAISRMEEADRFVTADIKDVKKIAKSLLYAIEKMPLYDTDLQAHSRLNVFDGFYRDNWYGVIHDDEIKYEFQLLECLLPKLAEKINLSDPGLCVGDCSMYKIGDFNWGEFPECIFDSYRSLCSEYGLPAMVFDTYTVKDKVPYVKASTLIRMQRDVVKAYLHLRENNVCGCGKLGASPQDEELVDWVENEVDSFDMTMFVINYLSFMCEVEGQLIMMSRLCLYLGASLSKTLSKEDPSEEIAKIEDTLSDYIARLKSHGILPADWKLQNPWKY